MFGSFVYVQNKKRDYLLNAYQKYMFYAADGQHRCAIQVS